LPTKTLTAGVFHWPVVSYLTRALLFWVYNGVFCLPVPKVELALSDADYLERLASCEQHLTGRFHAVCLSMLVETPFLAMQSNSSKVERLLSDCGLDASRLVPHDARIDLTKGIPFNAGELALIRAFRARAETESRKLFKDIASLACQHRDAVVKGGPR
jgi:polysaccharide pyruvyl transferase WcaK-like protein